MLLFLSILLIHSTLLLLGRKCYFKNIVNTELVLEKIIFPIDCEIHSAATCKDLLKTTHSASWVWKT